MTWHTPLGNRILDDIEQAFFMAAFYDMTQKINVKSVVVSIKTGVHAFDVQSGGDQLFMIGQLKKHLFQETSESTTCTDQLHGAVRATIAFVHDEVEREIVSENRYSDHLGHRPQRKWRMFLGGIFEQYDWKVKAKNELDEWSDGLSNFQDRIVEAGSPSQQDNTSLDCALRLRATKSDRYQVPAPV